MSGSMETSPEALVRACISNLALRSFWDVGANVGHYSWLMKSAVPNIELVLIEPLPENAALIRETMARHRFSDTTLIVAGASDSLGQGVLHADKMAGATSSLEQQGETFEEFFWGVTSSTIPIALTTIDDVRKLHGKVDFMKIDVEGHEEAVLRGGDETIRRDQPILFVECGHQDQACLRRLESEGYRIVDADRLSVNSAEQSTNFFCFPMRHTNLIEELLKHAREESAV
jgi:FkbM family methyltransferase